MADLSHRPDTEGQENSLQTLLAAIDRETAQELALDAALLKERASRNIRKKKPYIAFLLGNDEMALAIDSIQEIGYLPAVTPLPNLPPWIRGIVQIRGEILSVIDCCLLFGIREERYHLRRSYVLFQRQELKFCLMADRITGVVNLDEQRDPLVAYEPEQRGHLARLAPFFKGVYTMDDRTVHILDGERLGSSPLIREWQ
ncbi:chemotaxis protein CheW [Desulfobulbus elongatus]|uniref:chemotaxis protein CheW n=1 Tax=Desulfobulbus elongatus TaxID=53332 RepID=UPI0004886B8E|nr:chemotaxis protein CheW [Desulfobulbus elongatus]